MHYASFSSWSQRAAWYPYFDDANAILFLAPISCFDELLAEDRRVNRLEDSFLLWKGIIQSKLLAKCIIVCTSSITFRLSLCLFALTAAPRSVPEQIRPARGEARQRRQGEQVPPQLRREGKLGTRSRALYVTRSHPCSRVGCLALASVSVSEGLTCTCDRLDLHQKFRDQHREYSPQTGRPFYGYVTTAVVRLSSLIAFGTLF